MFQPSFLIPLAAALGFPLAAMALKRAMDSTRDPWGVLFVCNLATAFVFLPFFLLDASSHVPAPGFEALWKPLAAGSLFFLGQVAAFKSFQGELSIGITVQGAKVLMVALLATFLLDQRIKAGLWLAAALSAAAIHVLRDPGDGGTPRRKVRYTMAYSALAALAFAAFDVSVQAWSPGWGALRFGPWAFLSQALLSLSLLLVPGPARFRYPAKDWAWLAAGAAGLALVTLAMVLAIGIFGKATEMNLFFNTRCVWSVLFVWLAGRWFGNREAKSGRRAMAHRLAGAGLMMAAIAVAWL